MRITNSSRSLRWTVFAFVLTGWACLVARAQQPDSRSKGPSVQDAPASSDDDTRPLEAPGNALQNPKPSFGDNLGHLTKDFLTDQKQIWTSPTQLRLSDTQWLVPLSGITAGFFVTDADVNKHLSHNPSTINHYKTISNAGVGALIGGAGGMWLLGHASHNKHWQETGFLAGEAALNSLVMVEALKYPLGRERPYQAYGNGNFFQGGTSFPSEHAAAAWSVAGVLAHEYPGPLMKIAAYSLASLVDISRIRGQQHFPSDVVVGSLIGNFIAQNIYSRHHDLDLGGTAWRSISRVARGDGKYTPANMGSPYVPLDSWVYPVFDRLIALGYIQSAIVGMRPWTRLECARLLNEADDLLQARGFDDAKAMQLYDSLAREFSKDLALREGGANTSIQAESIYTRFTGISGEPLTDGFYFGQTILNDFGRPYSDGLNTVDGFSGWASEGRLTAYFRGEFQHAPSIPALPEQARLWISTSYGTVPVPPDVGTSAVNQFQLLDAYVAMNFANWQLSYGKQSLYWGPSLGGPMVLGDNAVPITMFRIDRVSPFKLPWILGWLGPMRFDFFLGQLAGHNFVFDDVAGLVGQWGGSLVRQPMIHGEKLSFKPTRDFEFSVSSTTLFAGGPTPFNWHTLGKAFTSFIVPATDTAEDITSAESVVDFTYRVPGMRKWLTFYGEAYTKDEFSPLGYPRKSAYQGGIYMPRIPGIPKLDLRLEGGSSDPPDFGTCLGCFFTNGRFLSGYTNQGNPMGSWLGREGQGEQAWTTYWLSNRNKIQFHYRHQKAVANFVDGGGTINDAGVKADVWLNSTMQLSGDVQYEKWNYPLLAPNAATNVTASVGVTFWPRNWSLQGH